MVRNSLCARIANIALMTLALLAWANPSSAQTYCDIEAHDARTTNSGSANLLAIQGAINTCKGGNGHVFIPGKAYTVTGTLTINDNVAIVGAGRGSSVLAFTSGGFDVDTNDKVIFRDFTLTTNSSSTAIAIAGTSGIGNGPGSTIRDMHLSGCNICIDLQSAWETYIVDNLIDAVPGTGVAIKLANSLGPDSGGYHVQGN